MAENQNKKRVFLTIQQKMIITEQLKQGVSVTFLSRKYGVSRDVIYRIRRECIRFSSFGNRGGSLLQHKNRRTSSNEDLENRLYAWFLEQRTMDNRLTDSSLQEKAIELCNEHGAVSFTGSRGWVRKFKSRYGIRLGHAHEEKESADSEGANKFVNDFTKRIKEEQEHDYTQVAESNEKEAEEDAAEVEKSNNSELNLIEKKKKDLNLLDEIIKRYANGNEGILLMGEAMKKFLENETPQIRKNHS